VSWKKLVKYLQTLFFVLLIVWYNLYNYTKWVYYKYNEKLNELHNITMKVKSMKDDITKIQEIIQSLEHIKENKEKFITAYNHCYSDYSFKKYDIWSWNIVSLKNCINNTYNNISNIENFKDIDLENIWISFGIYKDNSIKMNFDQKSFLVSLDKNIFLDNLEAMVPLLSFSNPVLINKDLWLYKVSFTFSINLSYAEFKNLFNRMQNMLYNENNIYYTIDNIWRFDIMNETEQQIINIQWSFYFSR